MLTNQQGSNEDENTIDGDLSRGDYPMLERFFQRYPPGSTFKDAALTMSTEEIHANITSHSGAQFTIEQIFKWLDRKGYNQETLGDGKFVWLIGDGEKF